MTRNNLPNSEYEKFYWGIGKDFIAGVDEAGRGPLAGPVVAASVIFPKFFENIYGINDSKKLSKEKRFELFFLITEKALAISACIIPEYIIDEINIYHASILAMEYSIEILNIKPDFILVDGTELKNYKNYKKIIKGDQLSVSIAAASIIAKVIRDNIMGFYHLKFPCYNFKNNCGYPTKEHKIAIKKFGICPIHRKSFQPVKNFIKNIDN